MGLRTLTFHRKLRRFMFVLRRYNKLLGLFLILGVFLGIFYEEVIYQFHILTINIKPFENAVTLWSSDFHISPIHDLKNILIPLGVKFFDKSLSYSCILTRTCTFTLRVLNRKNGMNPSNEVRSQFYKFYKDQVEMNVVDAFVCFHPVAMCETYLPFNRSLIIISSTRYELARFEPLQWTTLNENLIRLSKDPKNFIGSNNLYDAEYIRYFTGIKVPVIPSFCNYTDTSYNPNRPEFLLSPTHDEDFKKIFQKLLNISLHQSNERRIKILPIRSIYPRYKYSDLARHPAIVHVPYQVSIMSLFEQYRMNIPLVFPSLNLLTEWHYEYGVVNEKTWHQAIYGKRPKASTIPGVLENVPDPNNDLDRKSIRYWLNFSDFYQWPHITYYESTDDLLQKLTTTNFREISVRMKKYNRQVAKSVHRTWKQILSNIKQYSKKFQ